MTEDFIIEEEHEEEANRRPFLIAVGILLSIFILALLCSGTLLLTRGSKSNGNADQIAARETENAEIAVTNTAVAQIIAARETEAARPSDTPVPPTNTPIPTNTQQPTNTPVVVQAGNGEGTVTPDLSGTSTFSDGSANNTPTPISDLSGANGGNDSLPQTGLETWGVLIAAFGLIAVVFLARRLRNG